MSKNNEPVAVDLDPAIAKKVKLRLKWFKDHMLARGLTNTDIAAKLGLQSPDVSRIINAKRAVKATEATIIAKLFEVPLEEVLKRSEMLVSDPRSGKAQGLAKKSPYLEVSAAADVMGNIISVGGIRGKRVARPTNMGAETKVIRVLSPPMKDWLAYFLQCDYVDPKAVGSLCVVETMDGRKMLREVGSSDKQRHYTLFSPRQGATEVAVLKSASPVVWLRQDLL